MGEEEWVNGVSFLSWVLKNKWDFQKSAKIMPNTENREVEGTSIVTGLQALT